MFRLLWMSWLQTKYVSSYSKTSAEHFSPAFNSFIDNLLALKRPDCACHTDWTLRLVLLVASFIPSFIVERNLAWEQCWIFSGSSNNAVFYFSVCKPWADTLHEPTLVLLQQIRHLVWKRHLQTPGADTRSPDARFAPSQTVLHLTAMRSLDLPPWSEIPVQANVSVFWGEITNSRYSKLYRSRD